MKIKNGWIEKVRNIPSPNFDARPTNCLPTLIVIHCISLPPGKFGGDAIDDFFTNKLKTEEHSYFKEIQNLTVSSHLLIKRNGALTQYVSLESRAWHAGQSIYCGQENCNDFSIGIELEGTEELSYSEQQYLQLHKTISSLIKHYPNLSTKRIVGHSEIAPDRKTDPGQAFNWKKLYRLLEKKT